MKPPNDKQRRFAGLVVSGRPHGRAYEEAGYKARGHSADTGGERLMRNNEVRAEIDRARAEAAADCRIDRQRAMRILCDIIETPIGQIGPDHMLAQELRETEGGATIKMPSKMDAIRELAKMLKWYEPEQHELEIVVTIGGVPVGG